MNYEVGKRYWRIKEDGGLYDFFIMKGIREARGVASGQMYFMDTYYDDKDSKVLTDTPLPPTPAINLIFDSEQKALDFLMDRLQKRKMHLEQEEFLEGRNVLV